jgi:predicted TIM-barrel fold metal-dependent hydrolase
VVEAAAAFPRLAACWVVLPPTTGEMPPPERLVEAMGAAGVRAVRLCPSGGRHQFPLGSADAAGLLAALDARRIPTLIDLGETSWGEVERIAKANPHLPLIVLNAGYRAARTAYPVLAAADNVRVEISHYQGCGLLREGVERFGPGRFVFGTGLPQFEPGCAVASVLYAEIGDEATRLVAGGNLEALLQGAEL